MVKRRVLPKEEGEEGSEFVGEDILFNNEPQKIESITKNFKSNQAGGLDSIFDGDNPPFS